MVQRKDDNSYTLLLNRPMKSDTSAIIFCDIIDNYGDAGFCIRFSRALLEYIKTVAIFTNKPSIFYKVIGENNLILINASTKILSIFHKRSTSFEIPYSANYIIFDLKGIVPRDLADIRI